MKSVEELLKTREIKAQKINVIVRFFTLFAFVFGSAIVGQSFFEKAVTGSLLIIGLIVSIIFWRLLNKKCNLYAIGYTGVLFDFLILLSLPFIWYNSVGGDSVSRAYILKTSLPITSLILISSNAFSIRPQYPLILTLGMMIIAIVVYFYAIQDSRVIFTERLVEHFLGDAVNIVFYILAYLTVLLIGLLISLITYNTKLIIIEAVNFQKANTQLSRYFSPNVVNSITNANTNFLKPGGKLQKVAVLFSDIRNFTSMSETMRPEEVMNFLSDYHNRMVNIIFKNGGTLDKFIGDALMVTFGTPQEQPDDVIRAVKTGIEMNLELIEFNKVRALNNLPAIQHGIGIHFGEVIAGNIGTKDRLEYTVIGDTVNIASRIETACKEFGETFIISNEVTSKLNFPIQLKDLGEIKVKGKNKPVHLFAVIGM